MQLKTGDVLRIDSLTARCAAACYQTAVPRDAGRLVYYAPFGDRCELYASDLVSLGTDAARVAYIAPVASVPATMQHRGSASGRGAREAQASAKSRRTWEQHHVADRKLRGAFYRELQPSEGVASLMAPVLARIAAARAAAESCGQPPPHVVGVHVRQGDALDLALRSPRFFHEGSSGSHDDAFVDLFAEVMTAAAASRAADGRATLFFLASDQQCAREQLRVRFGKAQILELEGDEHSDEGMEGRVLRHTSDAMLRAVAEWMLLATAVDLLIRARTSSFSEEASHAHNVRCVEVG